MTGRDNSDGAAHEMICQVIVPGQIKELKTSKVCAVVVEAGSEKYPQRFPVDFWGKAAEVAAGLRIGDVFACNFEIKGREWQGKYYAGVRGWNIRQSNGPGADSGPADDVGGGADSSESPF